MDWLKRIAFRWLVRDERFYDIMCALRGPDRATESIAVDHLKFVSTARVRGAVNFNPSFGLLVSEVPPTEDSVPLVPTLGVLGPFGYSHFRGHYLDAVIALKQTGFLRKSRGLSRRFW